MAITAKEETKSMRKKKFAKLHKHSTVAHHFLIFFLPLAGKIKCTAAIDIDKPDCNSNYFALLSGQLTAI